jgi:DNA-nicking Smr family endonuclease
MDMARTTGPRRPEPTPESPDEAALFQEAIAGAVPLAARDRVPAPRIARAPRTHDGPTIVPLAIERDGDRLCARAPGVSRAQLADLRRGRIRPEATLDLHGRTAAEAEADLRRFVQGAARARRRCVLIVHGQGRHSDGVAVLRDVVAGALTGPLSGAVHCLATAAPADGGAGATYVMVRAG